MYIYIYTDRDIYTYFQNPLRLQVFQFVNPQKRCPSPGGFCRRNSHEKSQKRIEGGTPNESNIYLQIWFSMVFLWFSWWCINISNISQKKKLNQSITIFRWLFLWFFSGFPIFRWVFPIFLWVFYGFPLVFPWLFPMGSELPACTGSGTCGQKPSGGARRRVAATAAMAHWRKRRGFDVVFGGVFPGEFFLVTE